MILPKKLQKIVGLTLTIFLLVSCGTKAIKPQPGATFFGPLELTRSGRNAEIRSASMELTITEDGAGFSSVKFMVENMSCASESSEIQLNSGGWSTTTTFVQPVEIYNRNFEFEVGGSEDLIKVSGQFTSPTEATATVDISSTTLIEPPGTNFKETINCDYGSWSWSGVVE